MNSLYNVTYVYVFVFISTFFFYVANTHLQATEKIKRHYVILFCVLCAIYFGFRDYSVGTDTQNYVNLFRSLNLQAGLGYILQGVKADFGIFTIGYVVGLITNNPSIFLFVVALLYISIYTWANYRLLQQNQYLIIILIVSFFFFYYYGLNGLKSGLALSLCLLSLSLMVIRRLFVWG